MSFQRTLQGVVRGLDKNQDIIFTGKSELNGEPFEYGVCLDGNGSYNFINFMRIQNWHEIVTTENSWDYLHSIIQYSHERDLNGGSTLIIMKAFTSRIEVITVGDSQIVIYKNGKLAYTNTPHNLKNPKEFERLSTHKNYLYSEKYSYPIPQIRNSRELQAKKSEYHYFRRETKLAMTQCLGHYNMTGYDPERHVEYFEETDTIDIIMGSDGLFEMIAIEQFVNKTPELTREDLSDIKEDYYKLMTMSADELVSLAEERWKKEDWSFHYSIKKFHLFQYPISFEGKYDDVSAITWRKKGLWDIENQRKYNMLLSEINVDNKMKLKSST